MLLELMDSCSTSIWDMAHEYLMHNMYVYICVYTEFIYTIYNIDVRDRERIFGRSRNTVTVNDQYFILTIVYEYVLYN